MSVTPQGTHDVSLHAACLAAGDPLSLDMEWHNEYLGLELVPECWKVLYNVDNAN